MSVFIPTCAYRTTLAQGDVGHDVAALQANLNAWGETQAGLGEELVVDGNYGGRTFRRARTYQRRRGLYLDGVFGPVSQRHLAIELMEPASDAHSLPHGLLRGQVELESAYFVGAVNCLVAGAKDCGWTQRRVTDGSPEARYRDAFHGPTEFGRSALELRQRKDAYYEGAAVAIKDHEYHWKAAVLHHNWPSAASRVASGGFDGWKYIATFDKTGPTDEGTVVEKIDDRYEKRRYSVDDIAQWILNIGAPNVKTGRQWKDFYTGKVCTYITEYGP